MRQGSGRPLKHSAHLEDDFIERALVGFVAGILCEPQALRDCVEPVAFESMPSTRRAIIAPRARRTALGRRVRRF